ncbi:hypothetical protein [Dietzia natronolimnaea]|uniref:hypothetical protein n=1 Tax=Dietzia natronolimnaea TaxID=161920 RepID=UPI0015FE71F4|nr:hypothetical protein [Dietzia natronolimnaea]MBB1037346.1 hypothetical protein [Dietzia natronolimnaea]
MTSEIIEGVLGIVSFLIIMAIVGYGAMRLYEDLSEYFEKRKNAEAKSDSGDQFDEIGEVVADAADVVAQQASFRTKAFMQFQDELQELRNERYDR